MSKDTKIEVPMQTVTPAMVEALNSDLKAVANPGAKPKKAK